VICDENEYRLTKYLLSNYERSVRPVANSSLPINVIFGMSIHHIIDVDEKNQVTLGVDFTKNFSPSEKTPAHSIWRKICLLISPTFYLKVRN
jgi:hypothetical protein